MSDLPIGWTIQRLGDAGGLFARRVDSYPGVRPYLATSDVNQGTAAPSGEFTYSGRPARADLLLKVDDVLQAKMKGTDKAFLVGEAQSGWLASTGFAQLNPQAVGNSSRFFLHVLSSRWFLEVKDARCVGSTQQAISDKELAGIAIALPPDMEQAGIADVLDAIDSAIHETETIIAKLTAFKQGLLGDLMTRGIGVNGELRPPQDEAPQLYKQSPLGWIPTDWSVAPVGTLLSELPRNGLYKPPHLIGRGALLVGQTAFTDYGSVKFEVARRAQVGQSELTVFGLQAGDLLISRVFATLDGVGQPVVVPDLPEAAVYESNMMRMRPKPGVVTSAMLFNLLKLPSSRAAVRSRAFLSNQASINRQGICSIELALPSWEEQLAIDARVKSLTDRLKQEIQALTKWRSEKAGLVDDLLTGRIRVTPLWADAERVKECV